MAIDFNATTEVITVQVPASPAVVQVQVPGLRGPAGANGAAGPTGATGPSNTITIGTVNTGTAAATLTGSSPNQVLNLTLPQGPQGIQGVQGPTGSTGPANTLTIGTVTTGSAGSNAAASITGTSPNQTLNLTIPTGATGAQGSAGVAGTAATITIGTVTTGAAGSSANVTNSGSSSAATFNFTIPQGIQGSTGSAGPANTLTIGTVTTGAAGSSASATVTGTTPNQTLNLTIPQGIQGPAGAGAPDATTTSKGSVQLAGDLAGTAALPTVPALANKANNSITITAGTGLTGGGDLTASRTLTVSYGTAAGTAAQGNDSRIVGAVQTTRQIISGTGLSGGGDLSADRTLAVAYGSAASTAVQGNDIRVTADQIATQASIRTIGTGALQAAAGNHTHVAANITDSTAVGRSLITAVDAPTARTAIGAGTGNSNLVIGTTVGTAKDGAYQPAAANISDSTAVGRSLITAADAPTARTAIGAGTGNSNLVIGTTAGTAKDGAYQPTAANISDSTATGRAVITSASVIAARAAIGAQALLPITPVAKTTAYTAAINEIAMMNVSGGGTTLTLPAAPADGTQVGFHAIGSTAAVPLVVNRGGTDTIGTSAATSISEPLNGVTRIYQYEAANTRWTPIADVKPLTALDARFAASVHTHTSSQISDATASGTANTIALRDNFGNTVVSSLQINNASPSFAFEATRKDYVDGARRPAVNSQTASYTLVLTDERKFIQMTSASATTLTVPTNATVAFPIGTAIQIQSVGAGTMTVAPAAGVTIQNAVPLALRQYMVYDLQKTATDTWVVYGNGNVVSSGGITDVQQITQTAYTALGAGALANVMYVIVG